MKCHLAWLALIACGDNRVAPDAAAPDAEVAPALWNRVSLPDAELAAAAARVLGADVPGARDGCNVCHGITRSQVRAWSDATSHALTSCLVDLAVTTDESARAMVDCMRVLPEVVGSDFSAGALGVWSAATHLPWFEYTLRRALGADAAAALADLQAQAGMPRGDGPRWTQNEVDLVAEWFARGLPELEAAVPVDAAPTTCVASISSGVAAHVATMATTGWRALNRASLLAMHGCGAATDPRACLTTAPRAAEQPYGAGWELPGRGVLRVLHEVTYRTQYWTRSSADGRFVAHGVANVPGGRVIDLARQVEVPIAAEIDPAFFPDHSGFAFHLAAKNVCAISVLTSNPASVSMEEVGCSRISSLGMYEHLGKLLGGGDYVATDSLFVSDDGGHAPTLDQPVTTFTSAAFVDFTPMIFDGTRYLARAQVRVATPFEGDAVVSPSTRLVMSRLSGPDARQLGFVLREVVMTPSGTSYAIAAPEIARYCVTGGKPGFSFDERWVVFHRYVTADDAIELGFSSAADPGFAPYLSAGAANLYLMELATGSLVRITHMAPGQYALFPHFRSDGWIYAQVRDPARGREVTIASDAALAAE